MERGAGWPTHWRRCRLRRNGKEVYRGWRGGSEEPEWRRKKNINRSGKGREWVLICRLRGSLCRQQCVVCFISAPLALWDGVWVKASGHSLPWRVQWWMFGGNLGHCSRNTINSVAVSQHDWEELYCGMCLCICAQMCVPRNSIVFNKVCVCVF